MRKQRALLWILIGVTPLAPMEIPLKFKDQSGEGVFALGVVEDESSEVLVQKNLAPLWEDAQRIHSKIEAFDNFLKQEKWDEAALETVFAAYRNLDEEVDTFPLRYRPLLDKVRHDYRMDESVDSIIRAHAKVLSDTTFGLFKYISLMFDLKSASCLCKDVRSALRFSLYPLSDFEISGLQKYEHWSCSEYQGLQRYLNERSSALLKMVQQRQMLYKERKQEEERLSSCARELEQCKHLVYESVLGVEDRIRKPVVVEEDMRFLSDKYEELLAAKKRLEKLKETAGDFSSVTLKGAADQRRELVTQSAALHDDCSSMVARCEQLKIDELRNIFTTFAAVKKDRKEKKGKKQVEDKWFLADVRKKWMNPFPPYYVQHLSYLLLWRSECEPLQTAVRVQAKKYLQQNDDVMGHSAVQQMTLLADEFYKHEKHMRDGVVVDTLRFNRMLISFKQKIVKSTDVLEKFKTYLIKKVEEFLRGDS